MHSRSAYACSGQQEQFMLRQPGLRQGKAAGILYCSQLYCCRKDHVYAHIINAMARQREILRFWRF